MCAVTITNQHAGPTTIIADVEATADADIAATIPHGFGEAPVEVTLTPLQAEFYVSAPEVTTLNATNIVLTMTAGVGSGVAGDQIRVVARLLPDRAR